MKAKVIRDGKGVIRNVGDWDYRWAPKLVEALIQATDDEGRPLYIHRLAEGRVVTVSDGKSDEPYMVKAIVQEKDADGNLIYIAENPMPDDHYEDEAELQEGADGALYESYGDLRRVAYPKLADQLDALWKGGEALEVMRAQVLAVKAKYPK